MSLYANADDFKTCMRHHAKKDREMHNRLVVLEQTTHERLAAVEVIVKRWSLVAGGLVAVFTTVATTVLTVLITKWLS